MTGLICCIKQFVQCSLKMQMPSTMSAFGFCSAFFNRLRKTLERWVLNSSRQIFFFFPSCSTILIVPSLVFLSMLYVNTLPEARSSRSPFWEIENDWYSLLLPPVTRAWVCNPRSASHVLGAATPTLKEWSKNTVKDYHWPGQGGTQHPVVTVQTCGAHMAAAAS